MGEQLLTPTDVAKKLRISRAKFYQIRVRLMARGMKKVMVDSCTKYLESSIDRMILKSAETETPLV
jgi:hypothetical protein